MPNSMRTLNSKEQKMHQIGYKVNSKPWKSTKIKKEMTIINHGFVQHSFNRNLGDLLSKISLFWPDCV